MTNFKPIKLVLSPWCVSFVVWKSWSSPLTCLFSSKAQVKTSANPDEAHAHHWVCTLKCSRNLCFLSHFAWHIHPCQYSTIALPFEINIQSVSIHTCNNQLESVYYPGPPSIRKFYATVLNSFTEVFMV